MGFQCFLRMFFILGMSSQNWVTNTTFVLPFSVFVFLFVFLESKVMSLISFSISSFL